jgi:CRP-like cAMP-binding protein
MQIRQSEVFVGLNPHLLKAIMAASTRHGFAAGGFVYHRRDPADYFYVLMEGEIELRLGDEGTPVFHFRHLGEVFGWSSLIGRPHHTVSAACLQATAVLGVEARHVIRLLEEDSESAVVFYRQLARALGNRLLEVCEAVDECRRAGSRPD